MAVWTTVDYNKTHKNERLDAKYFRPSFIDDETRVKNKDHVTLGEDASHIRRGKQPDYNESGDIPVLRTVNVRENGFNSIRQDYVTKSFHSENERGQVKKHDVLLASTGAGSLGRVGFHFKDKEYFADSHITLLRGFDKLSPFYVAAYLQSEIGKILIDRRYRGSSGQIEIYESDIASIPIPLIENDKQEEIAKNKKQADKKRREAERLHRKSKDLAAENLN